MSYIPTMPLDVWTRPGCQMSSLLFVILPATLYLLYSSSYMDLRDHFTKQPYQFPRNSPIAEKDFADIELKTILLWGKLYKSDTFHLKSLGRQPFYDIHCPVTNCNITNNKSLLPASAAVVFPMAPSVKYLPKVRYPHQLYVQGMRESPAYHVTRVDDVINITMTYRQDSDIFWPYVSHRMKENPNTSPYKLKYDLRKRTKNVVWLVSNCKTIIKREKYVAELSKHIDVEIIGKCGNKSCPKTSMWICMKNIAETYKFYISFENSFCVDYVTEKLARPMEYDLLPIVLGGTNYTRDAPPNSVINALDYKSPKHLAEYLRYLSTNDTAYLQYFQWKNQHELFHPGSAPAFCELCKILNQRHYAKRYENFTQWWSTDKCQEGVLKNILV